jgi:hypothetical protein
VLLFKELLVGRYWLVLLVLLLFVFLLWHV